MSHKYFMNELANYRWKLHLNNENDKICKIIDIFLDDYYYQIKEKIKIIENIDDLSYYEYNQMKEQIFIMDLEGYYFNKINDIDNLREKLFNNK